MRKKHRTWPGYWEVRYDENKELDEVVAGDFDAKQEKQKGPTVHLEYMDVNEVWIGIDIPGRPSGERISLFLHSKGPIKATLAELPPHKTLMRHKVKVLTGKFKRK